MVINVSFEKNNTCELNIGTHNGIFHCDEVVGTAILELAYIHRNICIVRTRDKNILNNLDIVIDVGFGEFDHHMSGFNKRRESGELYASAGLVWRKFGKTAISNIINEEKFNSYFDDKKIQDIFEQIDKEYIIPVDLEDNGEKAVFHTFSFITKFLPVWNGELDYNNAFKNVERIVYDILKQIIIDKISKVATYVELKEKLKENKNTMEECILEIPSQTMPWLETVLKINEGNNSLIKFVIFKYPAGGWAAQCVPPSLEEKFKKLVPFPSSWAGKEKEELKKVSGIDDAIFCHNGCFFARANSKESVIKMCKIALNEEI